MGFNTTVVVHNDALGSIERDPDFGMKLSRAISNLGMRGDKMEDVSAGCHCNACEVIETHHADSAIAVVVGGNMGIELGYAGNYSAMDKDDESKVKMLKTLALNLGYSLRKNPTKGKA